MENLNELNTKHTPGAVRRIAYCVKSCAVLAVLLCAVQVFLGCEYELSPKPGEGETGSQGEKLYTVSGHVGGSGAQNSARNAQAALPTADSYTVTVTPLDESGTPDASKAETIDVDENGSFSIQLLEGKYTFTAEGFKDGKRVLSGAYSANPFIVPRDISNPISITVTTISSDGGTGEVRLPLHFDENCGIKRVEARWERREVGGTPKTRSFTAGSDGVTATDDGVLTALTFTMKETDDASLPTAGLYKVNFYFYGETQKGVEMELYSCTESIYVSENLTTDTWQNESNKLYFTSGADGAVEFRLTKAVMNTLTMLYVDSGNGASSNSGSPFEPLDSIQTALERIELTNDSSTSFKIYLKTDIESTVDAPYGAETNSAFININPSQTLRLTIESERTVGTRTINANRSATNTGRVMYIGENADVTLNNIKITGGNIDDNGGGIFIYNGKLTLSGVTVSECTATSTDASSIKGNGGAVYNYNGTLTVTGGSITSCTAETSGGGVFNNVTDASVVSRITNCTVTTCTAEGTATGQGGGGIYNASGTLALSGVTITGKGNAGEPDSRYGGGIYNNGILTVEGGEISKCVAKYKGGGIYNSVTDASVVSRITNCAIITCKAEGTTVGHGGGGIYNNAGILELSGLTITGGNDTADRDSRSAGGGIYNNTDGTITITDGADKTTISLCWATSNGGGIYNEGTLTMNGGEISGCRNQNYGGGIYNKGTLTVTDGTITNCVSAIKKKGGEEFSVRSLWAALFQFLRQQER